MGRARFLPRELHCHNCNRTWWGMVYALDTHMRALHNLDPHSTCSRCSMTHCKPNDPEIKCKFLPDTCTCDHPHVEIISNPATNTKYAQVRAEQRSAVYLMPDGSVFAPETNRYDDPSALDAVAGGGVRHEFTSVHGMQQFQRDRRRADNDEFTDRCLVIDYDQSTILSRDHLIHKLQHDNEQAAYDRVRDRQIRGEVYFGGEYYERAKADYLRRSGK